MRDAILFKMSSELKWKFFPNGDFLLNSGSSIKIPFEFNQLSILCSINSLRKESFEEVESWLSPLLVSRLTFNRSIEINMYGIWKFKPWDHEMLPWTFYKILIKYIILHLWYAKYILFPLSILKRIDRLIIKFMNSKSLKIHYI